MTSCHKILIVDDDPDIRASMRALLESEGFAVVCAADGLEALRLLPAENPALLITDLRMPQMEGMELLDRIRAAAPAVKMLVVSAYGDFTLCREALRRGAEDLLVKPVRNAELLHSIRSILKIDAHAEGA